MKRIVLIALVLVFLVTVFSLSGYAQVGPPCPPGDPNCNGGDPDPSVPFDGGILFLVLGAIGFGVRKIATGISKT
jgi:hypothetical protein